VRKGRFNLSSDRRPWLTLLAGCALLAGSRVLAAEPGKINFRRDVLPILSARCFECHRGADASSGYRLDDRVEILGETNGQPLARPGRSAESLLLRRVRSTDPRKRMPPKGEPLRAGEIDILRRWIDEGLAWDDLADANADGKNHWAFQPIRRPSVPGSGRFADTRNPIDAFVAAKLEELGLRPAPEASPNVLIRRLSLDLLGLPPAPEEVEAFLADRRPDAWEALVDRMLASPQYGERWGRHWLDLARWAETEGYESNHPRPFAWRYRDYVVDAFNADRPYDEFIAQQLAGDELTPLRDENLIATGFLAAARLSSNEEDKALQRNQVLVDIVNAVGTTFLGLTIHCAQCHNHKFDPVTARDYYRLLAYFTRGQPVNAVLRDSQDRAQGLPSAEYEPARALRQAMLDAARQRLFDEIRGKLSAAERAALDVPVDRRSVEQELLARQADLKFQVSMGEVVARIPAEDKALFDALSKKVASLEKTHAIPQTWAFYSPATSPHVVDVLPSVGFYPLPYEPDVLRRLPTYLQVRGEVHALGPRVTPGPPAVLEGLISGRATPTSRRDLAAWLVDRRNPLTARVWANRIWQQHFGRGLVATAGDFGFRGEKPTHPELLDWLASELLEHGWSTKRLHRLIVNSRTYRQSSEAPVGLVERDPDNRWLARWRPRRLEAEAIRDTLLAATGELDRTVGGPSVPLEQAEQTRRRSLYLFQKRGQPPELQGLFDGPREAAESCTERHRSTTSLQSLYLLNDRFTWDRARKLLAALTQGGPLGPDRLIEQGFVRVLGRRPTAAERARAIAFLAEGEGGTASDRPSAGLLFCHALLNLNELYYLE
jgi:hypothetical protein